MVGHITPTIKEQKVTNARGCSPPSLNLLSSRYQTGNWYHLSSCLVLLPQLTFAHCSTTPQTCMTFEIHIMWPKENEILLLSLRDIIYCKDCAPGSEDRYPYNFNWICRLEPNALKCKWFAWNQGDHKSWMSNDSLYFKCHYNLVIFILQLCNWVQT